VCATMILINPLAKFALTMEPVALTFRLKVLQWTGLQEAYLVR
jgi:hypothetical protein